MSKKRKHVRKAKKLKKGILLASIPVIGAIIAFIVSNYAALKDIYSDWFHHSPITYSDCAPYAYGEFDFSPYYLEEYGDSPRVETSYAFAIRSDISNTKSRPIRIDSVVTKIESIEAVEEEDINIDMHVSGHTLKIFAVNNGWGDSKEHDVSFSFSSSIPLHFSYTQKERIVCPLTAIADEIFQINHFRLRSGEILQIGEFLIDYNRYYAHEEKLLQQGTYFLASVSIECDDTDVFARGYFLHYDSATDSFWLEAGSSSEEYYCTSILYAVLDVDKAKEAFETEGVYPSLIYTSIKSSPQVNETHRIETIIAPTKSCRVDCRNIFSIDGKTYETGVMLVNVKIPVYIGFDDYETGMIPELAKYDSLDYSKIRQVAKDFRYHPEEFNRIDE